MGLVLGAVKYGLKCTLTIISRSISLISTGAPSMRGKALSPSKNLSTNVNHLGGQVAIDSDARVLHSDDVIEQTKDGVR